MKSISIYAVTRNQNIGQLQKLERQLSGREYFLKMRHMGTGEYEISCP